MTLLCDLPPRSFLRVTRGYAEDGLTPAQAAAVWLVEPTFGPYGFPVGEGCSRPYTWNQLVDACYRYPISFGHPHFYHYSIVKAIKALTGYAACYQGDLHGNGDYGGLLCAWSGFRGVDGALYLPRHALSYDEQQARIATLKPAYDGFKGKYYYWRDVVAVMPRRTRCEGCGRKVRSCDRHRCEKRCARFVASPFFARLHRREVKIYAEHSSALVCSAACHDVVAARYERITRDKERLRTWVHHGKKQLQAVQALLPNGRRSKRPSPLVSPSHSVASSPRETSAI